jgi:hypothetical protein
MWSGVCELSAAEEVAITMDAGEGVLIQQRCGGHDGRGNTPHGLGPQAQWCAISDTARDGL